MPQAISLRGRNALSPFRYDKLMRLVAANAPLISHIYAEYWHFVAVERALDASEQERLETDSELRPGSRGRAASR